jgi:hypothetical protein
MENKVPLYKTIFRFLGIFINLVVIGFSIYTFALFHNIGNPSKGSFGDVALSVFDFYIWILTSIFLLIGTYLWRIGVKNNPNVGKREQWINKILLRFLLAFFIIMSLIFSFK